jgi:predicted 2-oxoglutarate/Fe(II)-dependent dioxygenase YbiX
MIEIHPNFFTQDELHKFTEVYDSDNLQDVPNTKDVKACINRRFTFGKRFANFGRQIYNELLYYPTNSYSNVHIDTGPLDNSDPWVRTILINCTDDYTGGELFFPNLNLEMRLPAGSLLVFPAGDYKLYAHGVRTVTSGSRMTAVIRFGKDN